MPTNKESLQNQLDEEMKQQELEEYLKESSKDAEYDLDDSQELLVYSVTPKELSASWLSVFKDANIKFVTGVMCDLGFGDDQILLATFENDTFGVYRAAALRGCIVLYEGTEEGVATVSWLQEFAQYKY